MTARLSYDECRELWSHVRDTPVPSDRAAHAEWCNAAAVILLAAGYPGFAGDAALHRDRVFPDYLARAAARGDHIGDGLYAVSDRATWEALVALT